MLLQLILAAGFALNAEAATARIVKVLPHLLDNEGRRAGWSKTNGLPSLLPRISKRSLNCDQSAAFTFH